MFRYIFIQYFFQDVFLTPAMSQPCDLSGGEVKVLCYDDARAVSGSKQKHTKTGEFHRNGPMIFVTHRYCFFLDTEV